MTPMQVIKKLFKDHFAGPDFEWRYLEGVYLKEVDPELTKEIERLLALGDEDKPV